MHARDDARRTVTARGQRRRTLVFGAAACIALALLGAMIFTDAPRASPAAADPSSATPFGSATPTEKFVQNFQQQVTQQLQAVLGQAQRAQETRLHQVELQQQQLAREQSDALQRALDQLGAARVAPPVVTADDPPRVNVRRARDAGPVEAGPLADGSVGSTPAVAGPIAYAGNIAADGPLAARIDSLDGLPAGERARRSRLPEPNVAPHGFIDGRLLNGVVAIVGGAERESVVALSGNYQSANGFVTDLDGCFALVQGRPELAAGRIDFKLSRLTCNFDDGASRTWDTSGWLVDADGIRGVRAIIVQNADKKAAVATVGGALAGVGQHLSQQQYQVRSGPTVSSSNFVGNAGQDALGGAANGAANALGQSIADYYNLYTPSLQVGGGTLVTVVLANELKIPASGRDLTQTHTAVP
jgi:hypothetical protein